MYSTYLEMASSASAEEASVSAKELDRYFASLSNRDEVLSEMLSNVVEISKSPESSDRYVYEANKYLYFCPEDSHTIMPVLMVLWKKYYADADTDGMADVIDRIHRYRDVTGKDCGALIAQYEEKYRALISKEPLSDQLQGVWVSSSMSSPSFSPSFFLNVGYDHSGIFAMIMNQSSYPSTQLNLANSMMRFAKGIEISDLTDQWSFAFYSDNTKYGDAATAAGLYDSSRQTTAYASSVIARRNVSTSDKLLTAGVGAVISAGFDFLGDLASTTTSSAEAMVFSGKRAVNGIMDVKFDYMTANASNLTASVSQSRNTNSKEMTFYKLYPEDHIYFADKKGHPLSPYDQNYVKSDMFKASELYALNKKYALYQPQYLIPMTVLPISGLIIYIKSIQRAINLPEGASITKPIVAGVCGMLIMSTSIPFTCGIRKSFKDKAILVMR